MNSLQIPPFCLASMCSNILLLLYFFLSFFSFFPGHFN
jgi:hypothetical protein